MIAVIEPDLAKDLSTALIDEFGSIGRILVETADALERVVGNRPAVIHLFHTAQQTLVEGLLSEVPQQLVSTTDQRLIDYLVATMGSRSYELLRVIFLSRSNHRVADEIVATGSTHSLTVYPRSIFKRAFELSSSAVIIVHNHPGGCVEPSRADIEFTSRLIALGTQLEIEIKDHIIITGTRWFSFQRRGLI